MSAVPTPVEKEAAAASAAQPAVSSATEADLNAVRKALYLETQAIVALISDIEVQKRNIEASIAAFSFSSSSSTYPSRVESSTGAFDFDSSDPFNFPPVATAESTAALATKASVGHHDDATNRLSRLQSELGKLFFRLACIHGEETVGHALKLVDKRCVHAVIHQPAAATATAATTTATSNSNNDGCEVVLWLVRDPTDSTKQLHYTCWPNTTSACQCAVYSSNVVMSDVGIMCPHVLAALIAKALESHQTIESNNLAEDIFMYIV
ncbi:hypothetical protein GQ42DRAFT_70284 [Ramicandelaber brevisporus]|nr:hypothetical protein GQ42DRAFT_70284 [Ramicandelaber brevisporus]